MSGYRLLGAQKYINLQKQDQSVCGNQLPSKLFVILSAKMK